jgi:hypothetical protein
MEWSEMANWVLGGGMVACIAGVLSMKSTVRKANAEAEKAGADADAVRIENTEHATRILVENIVKPLKEELNATREDLQAAKKEMASTKRELARFRKALDSANSCRYADDCPVLRKLRNGEKGCQHRGECSGVGGESHGEGQPRAGAGDEVEGADSECGCEHDSGAGGSEDTA